MKLSPQSTFVIYGADTRGREYYKAIVGNGMRVVAFIDKKAAAIGHIEDTPVYKPDDWITKDKNKDTNIVVISISNVFRHQTMAKQMHDAGYSYIVYKELYDGTDYGKALNTVYQAISMVSGAERLIGLELPAFRLCAPDNISAGGGKYEVQLVPIELLFGLTRELYVKARAVSDRHMEDLIPDKSLLYFTINKEMMYFFTHGFMESDLDAWDAYIRLYFAQRRCMVSGDTVNAQDEAEHLRDRYSIFQNMELLYNNNISFFYENPIDVVWNPWGYFNMQDGNNRAAFLFAKGFTMLPCRMSAEDYRRWLNEEKLAAVWHIADKIGTLEYPIPNPSFSAMLASSMPFCRLKLREICGYLYREAIDPQKLSVLDIGCRNGFMGQHFARMGASVTAAEQDASYRLLCEQVNELLYLKETVSDTWQTSGKRSFDIILIPEWMVEELPDILVHTDGRILIVDTSDPQRLLDIPALCDNYTAVELCRLFNGGRIIHTIIFTFKGHAHDKL